MSTAKPVPPPPGPAQPGTPTSVGRPHHLPAHRPANSAPVPVAPSAPTAAPPRQWSPRLVAAAVALILVGGLLAMYAVQASRSVVLVIARPVKAGAALQPADLSVAQVAAGPEVATMAQAHRDTILGQLARTDLPPGTLLTPALVTRSDGLVGDQRLVPLPLKPGQLPARGLSAGAKVDIVFTPANSSPSAVAPDTVDDATTAIPGYVMEVGPPVASSGVSVVDVRVAADSAEQVARFAATGTVVLVAHPTGS